LLHNRRTTPRDPILFEVLGFLVHSSYCKLKIDRHPKKKKKKKKKENNNNNNKDEQRYEITLPGPKYGFLDTFQCR